MSKVFSRSYFERQYSKSILKGDKPLQHRFWIRCINRLGSGKKLLDIGLGEGYFLRKAERYFECFGMDISRYAIEKTKGIVAGSKLSVGSVTYLNFRDNVFDIITCFQTLEHTDTPQIALREIRRVLKEGGLFIMTTPNIDSYGIQIKRERWHGYRDATHISLLPEEEWTKLLQEENFEVVEKRYSGFWDSPYINGIPNFLQHLFFKLPATLLFSCGINFPKRWSEDVCIVARG